MPTVSVITPTYNRMGLLTEAIASVRAQTFPDWELIVVDDGSADETPRLLEAYARRDARIRPVRQPNQGLSAARNAGLRVAKGEFVAFLDDDDLWLPEKLQVQVAFMHARPELGMCYSSVHLLSSRTGTTWVIPRRPGTTYRDLFERNSIHVPTAFVRRSCLDAVGHFNPQLRICQDFELWLRIARRYPIGFIDRPLASYRRHEGAMTASLIPDYLEHIEVLKVAELDPTLGVTEALRRKRIAFYYYKAARLLLEESRYREAARHFANAVRYYPAIGQAMKWDGQTGWRLTVRWLNPYLAVPYCALKGLVHADR